MTPVVAVDVAVAAFLDRFDPGDPDAMRSSVATLLLHLVGAAAVTAGNLCETSKGLRLLRGPTIENGDACLILSSIHHTTSTAPVVAQPTCARSVKTRN